MASGDGHRLILCVQWIDGAVPVLNNWTSEEGMYLAERIVNNAIDDIDDIFNPGAMLPPRYSAFSDIAQKVVAVPKSITTD